MGQEDVLSRLLMPIPGENPGGQDISYSQEFDEIKEARRADDPALAQGDWERELKTSDWKRVRQLCEVLLETKSKDIQVACWYGEALTHLDGFSGLSLGVAVLNGVVSDFWEFCYPELDLSDLDERAGKLEWFNSQLPLVIRAIPLVARDAGGYSWRDWEESREVNNLGLKDAEAMKTAVAEGKLTGEVFDKAAGASGRAFYEGLHKEIKESLERLSELEGNVDRLFGSDSPSLKDIRLALTDCLGLVTRLGGGVEEAELYGGGEEGSPEEGSSSNLSVAPKKILSALFGSKSGELGAGRAGLDRAAAVDQLRQVAQYFRQHEPHSPVSYLVERAAKWAEMPLDQWLGSVIKDEGTLGQLRELLDLRRD